jgi:hypothetical protein
MEQVLLYSFSNVYSLSLLSGMGITMSSPSDFFLQIQKQFKTKLECEMDPHTFNFSYQLMPLRAVYEKGDPRIHLKDGSTDSEKLNLQWNSSNYKKTISPKTQALLIYNEIKLAKYLFHFSLTNKHSKSNHKEKYIGMIFVNLAIQQGEFCNTHLRNLHGSFTVKKDKSKSSHTLSLKQKSEDISLMDQIYMVTAYANLYNILNHARDYPLYFNKEMANYFYTMAVNQLDRLRTYKNLFFEQKTRHLVNMIPLFIESIEYLHLNDLYNHFIIKLCAELTARELPIGQLSQDRFSIRPSSFVTHSRALKALIKGYQQSQYIFFATKAIEIYHHLNQYWNASSGCFHYKRKKKNKYSSKELGFIFGGLISLLSLKNTFVNQMFLEKQICSFFNSAFNISGLQITPCIPTDILASLSPQVLDPLDLSFLINNTHSCVLLKQFKFYSKKHKILTDQNQYNTNYALHATAEMLSLINSSLLEPIKIKENTLSGISTTVNPTDVYRERDILE